MRVRRVVVTRYGGRDVLRLEADEQPSPGPGEARVKVLAAGVSLADVLERLGAIPGHAKPPFTPGHDVVGIVDETGSGVGLSKGQMVVALLNEGGGHAEFVRLPETDLVAVPAGVDPEDVAGAALNYFIAYQMLHRVASVPRSGSVLVHGAAGGVGTAFLQLAGLAGITTYGTVSEGKSQVVRDLDGTPIDDSKTDFVRALRAMTGEVDAVFDPIGGTHYLRSVRVLRRGGTLVGFGASTAGRGARGKKVVAAASVGLLGTLKLIPNGRRAVFYTAGSLRTKQPESYRDDLTAVLGFLAEKKLSPVIAERLPLSEVARAHGLLERGAVSGKIVLTTDKA